MLISYSLRAIPVHYCYSYVEPNFPVQECSHTFLFCSMTSSSHKVLLNLTSCILKRLKAFISSFINAIFKTVLETIMITGMEEIGDLITPEPSIKNLIHNKMTHG